MPIEIEKKNRLTRKQREEVLLRLPRIGAQRKGSEFEVNTLYAGAGLDVGRSVLRLRRVGMLLRNEEVIPSGRSAPSLGWR
jgi:hypothetical protein